MTPEEQLSHIIEKKGDEDLFRFLQSLDAAQRKKLVPLIKKLAKYYSEFIQNGSGHFNRKGSDLQNLQVQYACFVCYNKQDYEKSNYAVWMLEKQKLEKIIYWYCPDWFSDFVNKQAGNDYIPPYLHYAYIMELADKGYLQPSTSLVAKLLPGLIYEQVQKGKKWYSVYTPEKLYTHPLTLTKHIWYLFEEETSIHYSGRYLQFENNITKEHSGWIDVFRNLVAAGRLDRSRLLRETLLATNKNFNKVLSGWFVDLFIALAPATEEILLLQKEVQTILNSPHSKTISMGLQYLKKISAEKSFDAEGLLAAAPVVLAGTTKSSTASCLMLVEQIGRKQKAYQPAIALLCCQVFIQANDELQTRAAKIIARFGSKEDESLISNLQPYQDGILQNARKLLGDFFTEQVPAVVAVAEVTATVTEELLPIPTIENTDDLLFLASQAFDNNESWHIDVLPAAVVRLFPQLRGPVLAQLQPALQRALKIIKDNLRSTQGHYDHMLAVFFIDVCVHLVRQHPAAAADLQKVFEAYSQKEGNEVKKWMHIQADSSYISEWSNYYKDPFYLPYKQLLTEALLKIRTGDTLPLLSTPTHQPAWIAPEVLVARVIQYQHQQKPVQNMDGQLALSRCRLQDTAEAITMAKEKLHGEWQRLLLFLLDKGAAPQGPFTQPDAWMISSLSKWPKQPYAAFSTLGYYEQPFENYTGQLTWQAIVEEFYRDVYSYENGNFKTTKVKDTRKKLKLNNPPSITKEESSSIKSWLQKILPQPKTVLPPALLYDKLEIKAQWLSNEYNDVRRALLMMPNNPEAFLPAIIRKSMQYAETGESDKKMLIATLQTLHELWEEYGEIAHLFVAMAMLSADKTVAGTAAEIWLHYAPAGKIDSERLGKTLGRLEQIELAPLKRFNDLVILQLFRVSALHNRLLQTVVEQFLSVLPDEPIRNLKKLLEIYTELLAMNGTKAARLLTNRLLVWKEKSAVSKQAVSLLQQG